jgi:serine/threonine protein kinase
VEGTRDVNRNDPDPHATMTASSAETVPPADEEAAARDAGATSAAFPAIAAGRVVRERYRLESRLGGGAMGEVWQARDLLLVEASDPKPDVALKLLGRNMQARRDAQVALQREAGKARSLAHPNIATVFTFDVDPASVLPFITMELLDGTPLDELVRAHPDGLPHERAMPLIRGLAAGLAYAHTRGIVHCDFKPGNAFVTREGAAKILDFGIARLAREADRAADSFDAGRLSALTPRYATVEMLHGGEPHTADDVYALGLTAYELLSGNHPYGGRSAQEAQARGLRPEPLKDIGRRRWGAIDRALALERSRRWPHAQAFLDAFEGVAPWVPMLAALAAVLAVAAGYSAWVGYSK